MTPESTPATHSRSLNLSSFLAAAVAAVLLIAAVPSASAQTPTMIVLRAMPAKAKKGETFKPLPAITQADIAEIKLGEVDWDKVAHYAA